MLYDICKSQSKKGIFIMKKCMKIMRYVLLLLLALIFIFIATHQILTAVEKKQYPATGKIVTVNGKHMSLSIQGKGNHTIVLLPGLGTVSPILDFMPLAEELAKNNRVVIVEPFGYGWSDIVSDERTLENEVEEIRSALSAADVAGPYILMPHSLTGLHAIYYANTYPDEVEGIVGIDCTLPSMVDYFEEETPKHMSPFIGQLANLGIMRIVAQIEPDNFISDNTNLYYSQENLDLQRTIAGWKANNKNVIDQMNHIDDSIAKTHDMSFSQDLPILFFTQSDEGKKTREDGKTSVSFYETYATNTSIQKVIPLNGPHYLHWTCKEELVEYTNQFISSSFSSKSTSGTGLE